MSARVTMRPGVPLRGKREVICQARPDFGRTVTQAPTAGQRLTEPNEDFLRHCCYNATDAIYGSNRRRGTAEVVVKHGSGQKKRRRGEPRRPFRR